MAKRNVTLQASSCKEKGKAKGKEKVKGRKNKKGQCKKGQCKKSNEHCDKNKTLESTPLLRRGSGNDNGQDEQWIISDELLNTLSPMHNHFIGLLNKDTLANVSAGIETLAALLSLEGERGVRPSNAYHGAYWLALNMIEALEFEISYRHQLVNTAAEN